MSDKNIRTFTRVNGDGSVESVSIEWQKDQPMATFALDANGFKGQSCVETLRGIEDAIGNSSLTMKSDAYDSDGEQDCFIVGYNN